MRRDRNAMHFHFGTRKVVEAAATLLRCETSRRMSYLRLLKLLYISDRESLAETARPIVGTVPVAMKHGPVLSEILDLVRGQHWDEATWSEFIRRDGYEVELTKDPGVLSLSRYEIEKLTQTAGRYRDTDDWQLVGVTHEFAEWKGNYQENTSTVIPLEDIIEAVGRSADCAEILRDAERSRALDKLFAGTA
jgi:uncharacterized phage-associated protein